MNELSEKARRLEEELHEQSFSVDAIRYCDCHTRTDYLDALYEWKQIRRDYRKARTRLFHFGPENRKPASPEFEPTPELEQAISTMTPRQKRKKLKRLEKAAWSDLLLRPQPKSYKNQMKLKYWRQK